MRLARREVDRAQQLCIKQIGVGDVINEGPRGKRRQKSVSGTSLQEKERVGQGVDDDWRSRAKEEEDDDEEAGDDFEGCNLVV